MTYRQALVKGKNMLLESGITEAENDAWLLLAFICKITRTDYLLQMMEEMPPEKEKAYLEVLGRRAGRIPLQHLTGEQEFMGLTFKVSEDVLCPRQDTETLVEEAEKTMITKVLSCRKQKAAGQEISFLDLCTGSGCIAISLLAYAKDCGFPVQGTASDLSEKALVIAKENAVQNKVQLKLVSSNLFDDIFGKYDMIVSNPPYIRTAEIADLMPEVALHEPLMALDGKEDGLYFYRKIAAQSKAYLNAGGVLLLEIGYDQGKDVSEMLIYEGFKNVRVIRDLAHNDRVVIGEL